MNAYQEMLVKTARDFPAAEPLDVADIARIRTERAENAPTVQANNYTKIFSHFENGKPVFKWQNLG